MLIRCAFGGVSIGNGEGIIEEFTPTHEIVSGEPIENIFGLMGINIFASSPIADVLPSK